MQFNDLKLIEPLLRAVRSEGYTTPSPIQVQAIPFVLEGRDLIGCAQTGTGKTAAFALPILQRLAEVPNRRNGAIRVLVLSPTRELAAQIGESFATYGRYLKMRHVVIYGGVGQNPQVQSLRRGADILVATPGRLLDLMNQGYVELHNIETLVLDEADRMLDMGFIHDVRRVIAQLPSKRQTLLFSATMPQAIQELADQILSNPARVSVVPQATTVETIDQSVFFVDKKNKRALLEHLLSDAAIRRVLVFTRTKHGANKLAEQLTRSRFHAEAIHGNKSQSAREKALANFKAGRIRVLVATDLAARGIDVDDVTHVINFDLPNEPESYVHRIGRTARAGASGVAYSFCDVEERKFLRDIERVIRLRVKAVTEHPYALHHALTETAVPAQNQRFDTPKSSSQSENTASRQRQRNRPARRRYNTGRAGESASDRHAG